MVEQLCQGKKAVCKAHITTEGGDQNSVSTATSPTWVLRNTLSVHVDPLLSVSNLEQTTN